MSTATTAPRGGKPGGSLAHRLYTGQLSFDFIGHTKRWFTISGALLAISLLALAIFHLNLSIDFKGGTVLSVPTHVTASSIDDFRKAAQGSGVPNLEDVLVNTVGDNQVRVEVRSLEAGELGQMRQALAAQAHVPETQVTNSLIGASWGQQITQSGLIALGVFLVLVSLLMWAYFRDWKAALAALVGLLHDLLLTVGVFALLRFSFSPASLIGMLTILGYSLYDNVVVFDKVRENVRDITKQNRTFGQAANQAINQVLVRSINTTIIGVLPVAALLFAGVFILGTGPLKDLGLALFVGMIAGAYSSVFIATPLLVWLREREPAMIEHRKRLERRAARRKTDTELAPIADEMDAVPADASTLAALPTDAVDVTALRRAGSSDRRQPQHRTRADRKKP